MLENETLKASWRHRRSTSSLACHQGRDNRYPACGRADDRACGQARGRACGQAYDQAYDQACAPA